MIKKILPVLIALIFVFLAAKSVFATYLSLTRIGTLSTAGIVKTTWSISGELPDFSGTATPGAMVAITTNAVTATTSTGLSGVWIYKPNNIVGGTNSVSIASGNESIAFLLNYVPVVTPTPTILTATVSALPETGGETWPLIVVGAGIMVFVIGRAYKGRVEEEWNI